eukprot:TRINITY_DN31899_c0_g1_i1.p1 TRINITY_DN31899_c0_g1~~TRINITY_DN31899_c0_g1_i1.p1  ORF type:complete len:103 (-),score=17.38 TRINITY_DN31899_c0_g1_i1:121-429(-)
MEYAHDIYGRLGISYAEALTYLVDTEYGGELVFPAVPAVIKPSAGSMVVWRDTDEEGLNDFSTLRRGMPCCIGRKVDYYQVTLDQQDKKASAWTNLDSHLNE